MHYSPTIKVALVSQAPAFKLVALVLALGHLTQDGAPIKFTPHLLHLLSQKLFFCFVFNFLINNDTKLFLASLHAY